MPAEPVQKRALILVVDDDEDALAMTRRALERRLAVDYDIVADQSPQHAVERLHEERARGTELALVLADIQMPEMDGFALLAAVAETHPEAKRAALVTWGELERTREPVLRAVSRGLVEAVVAKPWRDAHESFYANVGQVLDEWDRAHRPQFQAIRMIGDRWDPWAQQMRDALHRSGVPFGFYERGSDEGRRLLEAVGIDARGGADGGTGDFPVLIVHDGSVLRRPTPVEVAGALGVNADPVGERFDMCIVGSGPAGLAAAVYAASEGLSVIVVEHQALGGQASTSSMIKNYLGFPRGVSGADLAARAYRQAWFFGTRFLIGRSATALRRENGHKTVVLDDGSEVSTTAVVLASGVAYRRLKVEGLDAFVGRGVFYGAPVTEAPGMAGEQVVVVGGGNSSAQMALYLARWAGHVILVTRSEALSEMSDYLVREIEARPQIEVRRSTVVAGVAGDSQLTTVRVSNQQDGSIEELPAAGLFIMIGAEPRTAWLPPEIERDERGYILTGDDVSRPTDDGRRRAALETSMPGVYAVGDVRMGSLKRIAAAVGEGSTVVRMCHDYFAMLRRSAES